MKLEVGVHFESQVYFLSYHLLQETLEIRTMEPAKEPLILKNGLHIFDVIIVVQAVRDQKFEDFFIINSTLGKQAIPH